MARDWEMRHPLVDGQGNLGSIDGDGAASADYTEMRLGSAGADVLDDARFPNLLVNGAFGVESGAASSFPPHNLREVVDAVIAVIDDPALDADDLQRHLPGPDFPTGAVVVAGDGLREAYATGRGAVVVRARADVYPVPGSPVQAIVISELPFLVSKGGRGGVLAEIRRAIRGKKVRGIDEVRDQSSTDDGLRIVVELRREADPDAVLEQLYAHTPLQSTLALELVATVAGEARTIGLRDAIGQYVEHRRDLVARSTGLRSEDSVLTIVKRDLLDIAERHGDERRSEIR
jgi:DNA gyrase subunit A